jgi:hypothetical protein
MNQIECLKSKVEGLFYYKKAHPPLKAESEQAVG